MPEFCCCIKMLSTHSISNAYANMLKLDCTIFSVYNTIKKPKSNLWKKRFSRCVRNIQKPFRNSKHSSYTKRSSFKINLTPESKPWQNKLIRRVIHPLCRPNSTKYGLLDTLVILYVLLSCKWRYSPFHRAIAFLNQPLPLLRTFIFLVPSPLDFLQIFIEFLALPVQFP